MQQFGPYTDLTEIGRGGMSVVYRATAPDGRLVVLKLMAPHLTADPTARRRFEFEGRLALNHPNIARIHRVGVHEGTPYIEMEYVAGQTLSALVARQGPLSPPVAGRILADIASALDYAHRRGVIHRDVKPSNIIIRPDGRAVLTDFGVAKLPDATAYTATTARVGSVLFMSPEQAAGAYTLTPASDIYSLGVTIYYALTGRTPFQGSTDVAIARQHIEQPPPHPSEVCPTLPRAIGDVLMQALDKSPAQRPASAGALARSFAAALRAADARASGVPSAGPASTAMRGRSGTPAPAQRNVLRLGLLAGLSSAAVLVAALSALLVPSSPLGTTSTPPRATGGFIEAQAVPLVLPSPAAPTIEPARPTSSPLPTRVPAWVGGQPLGYVAPTPTRTPPARPTKPERVARPTRHPPDPLIPIASSATLPSPSGTLSPTDAPSHPPTVELQPTATSLATDAPSPTPTPELPSATPQGDIDR